MFATRMLNGLLMVAIPIGLAAFVNLKFRSNWRLWWIGGAVFVLSQIGHIPFNYYSSLFLNKTNLINFPQVYQGIFNAVFLGVSAGLWEEFARYAAFRWWIGKSKSWRKAIQLGVGHGGFESILLGLLVLYAFIQMVAVKNLDIRTLVPPDQLAKTIGSIEAYWAVPWYDTLLGVVERLMTLPIQIAFSVIILQNFIRGQNRWIWIAILFHTVVDATAVILMTFSNIYIAEFSCLFFSALSIWIIIFLKSPEPINEEPEGYGFLVDISNNNFGIIKELDESLENLETTKYRKG